MEPPRKYIDRLLETCLILAVNAFLLRLAVAYILEIWPYLLIAFVIIAICVICWRVWKHSRNGGKW